MKSMKYTNNIYPKFWIHTVTERPALQYVCTHVNGHSCLLALFLNYVTYKWNFLYIFFILQSAHPLYTNRDLIFDSQLTVTTTVQLQIIRYPSPYTQYGIIIVLTSSITLHQFVSYLIFWFTPYFLIKFYIHIYISAQNFNSSMFLSNQL
jgi:hypothetical protein